MDRVLWLNKDGEVPRRRVFARWPFAQQFVPVREVDSPARTIVPMTCKNLSAMGVGLVSTRRVEVGRIVGVTLRSLVRGAVEVRGRVVRCESVSSDRYEVAVALEAPIEVREFAPTDPLSNQTVREYVDPVTLRGRVLVVSATAGDRAAFTRALRTTSMVVTSAASVSGALDIEKVDIAVLTCNEGDEKPGSVLLDLYEHGFTGKVVLVVPERSPRVRQIVDKLPLAGVLVKPVDDGLLLRVLADVGAESAGGAGLRNVA